jgi:steroid delta-isomerase-like uncharacterized protein
MGCCSAQARRLAAVDEHVRRENRHDIRGLVDMYKEDADFHDTAWRLHHRGQEAIRRYYDDLMQGLPDLHFDVLRRHACHKTVVIEGVASGHHFGQWRGLPSTGRRIELPMCAVFAFEEGDRFSGETIFYDRATVLRQLAMFHEPDTVAGRVTSAVMHPLTIARIVGRMVLRR